MSRRLSPPQIDEIFDAAEHVDVPVTQLLDAAADTPPAKRRILSAAAPGTIERAESAGRAGGLSFPPRAAMLRR